METRIGYLLRETILVLVLGVPRCSTVSGGDRGDAAEPDAVRVLVLLLRLALAEEEDAVC